ncbi:MAG: sugar ABC transporter substrate-binding protein, partial [Pseudomonadota bacterium]
MQSNQSSSKQHGGKNMFEHKRALLLSAAVLLASPTIASADCGIEAGSIRILGNDFAAIHAVTDRAKSCATGGVSAEANLTTEHRDLQVAALTADPAQYTTAIVANSSIVPLLNADLVRPLNDLVEKHGQSLSPTQLITIDGNVMAVAFMANAQHLFYRKDVLDQVGVGVP